MIGGENKGEVEEVVEDSEEEVVVRTIILRLHSVRSSEHHSQDSQQLSPHHEKKVFHLESLVMRELFQLARI